MGPTEQGEGSAAFGILRSIELGRSGSVHEMRNGLYNSGCIFKETGVDALLDRLIFRRFPYVIQVTDITVEELGLGKSASFQEILEQVMKTPKLEWCPDELGPELARRHEIRDFTRGMHKSRDVVHIATRPILPREGGQGYIFRIRQGEEEKKIEACPVSLVFEGTDRFLFVVKSSVS